mmetsp:Transcript_24785/g.59861  ORF Transcript_24785/g.59861 Transcript_24785/m.59861 type:complete len:309 (+) Transcript_24785:356-1282(+)
MLALLQRGGLVGLLEGRRLAVPKLGLDLGVVLGRLEQVRGGGWHVSLELVLVDREDAVLTHVGEQGGHLVPRRRGAHGHLVRQAGRRALRLASPRRLLPRRRGDRGGRRRVRRTVHFPPPRRAGVARRPAAPRHARRPERALHLPPDALRARHRRRRRVGGLSALLRSARLLLHLIRPRRGDGARPPRPPPLDPAARRRRAPAAVRRVRACARQRACAAASQRRRAGAALLHARACARAPADAAEQMAQAGRAAAPRCGRRRRVHWRGALCQSGALGSLRPRGGLGCARGVSRPPLRLAARRLQAVQP